MPRKPRPPGDDPEQSKRFIEMAREIGADEGPEGRGHSSVDLRESPRRRLKLGVLVILTNGTEECPLIVTPAQAHAATLSQFYDFRSTAEFLRV